MSVHPELSVVSLARPVKDDDGRMLPWGAAGTVVHVYPDERAYLVEFNRPFHTVATVEAVALVCDRCDGLDLFPPCPDCEIRAMVADDPTIVVVDWSGDE